MAERRDSDCKGQRSGTLRSFVWDRTVVVYTALKNTLSRDMQDVAIPSAALTYFSMMSIVSFAALFMAIFISVDTLSTQTLTGLLSLLLPQWVVTALLNFSENMLSVTAGGGWMAAFAIIALLVTVVNCLRIISRVFSRIWTGRSPKPRFRDVLSETVFYFVMILMVLLMCMLVVMLGGFSPDAQVGRHDGSPILKTAVMFMLGVFLLVWIFFMYWRVLNKGRRADEKARGVQAHREGGRILLLSALISSIISGIVFFGFQNVFEVFQRGMVRINITYGRFADLIVLIIRIRLSWWILLFGCYLAKETYEEWIRRIDLEDLSIWRRVIDTVTGNGKNVRKRGR